MINSDDKNVTWSWLYYILAELEEDFLKDENRPRAAQDGEGLTGKKRVGYPSHGSPEQGLNSTLKTQETMH